MSQFLRLEAKQDGHRSQVTWRFVEGEDGSLPPSREEDVTQSVGRRGGRVVCEAVCARAVARSWRVLDSRVGRGGPRPTPWDKVALTAAVAPRAGRRTRWQRRQGRSPPWLPAPLAVGTEGNVPLPFAGLSPVRRASRRCQRGGARGRPSSERDEPCRAAWPHMYTCMIVRAVLHRGSAPGDG